MVGLIAVANNDRWRGVNDGHGVGAIGEVAVAVGDVPEEVYGFQARAERVGDRSHVHDGNATSTATDIKGGGWNGRPRRPALDGLIGAANDDRWCGVAEDNDIKCADGGVAEIVLNNPCDGVRPNRKWRAGRRGAENIGDIADTGVGDEGQRKTDVGEPSACGGVEAGLYDDVRRANDVEAGAVGKSIAEGDSFEAEIHNAASHANPLRRDDRPVGEVVHSDCDRTGAARRIVRPTQRADEWPTGGVAGNGLVCRTDEGKTVGREPQVEHEIASVGVEAGKISESESDWRAASHRRAGWRKLRAGKTSRGDARKPTVGHHCANIRDKSAASVGEHDRLCLKARAVQKLRLRPRRRKYQRDDQRNAGGKQFPQMAEAREAGGECRCVKRGIQRRVMRCHTSAIFYDWFSDIAAPRKEGITHFDQAADNGCRVR